MSRWLKPPPAGIDALRRLARSGTRRDVPIRHPLGVSRQYDLDGILRRNVFPDPQDVEAKSTKADGAVGIPRSVSLDLVAPERLACFRHHEVVGTAVPEAAVDKDVQTRTREYNVGASATIEGKLKIDAEAQACAMEQ